MAYELVHSGRRTGRRRRWTGSGVLAVMITGGLVLVGCGPVPGVAPPPGPAAPADAVTATVYARTNADRGARGLPPLAWDPRLAGLAQEWAQHLSDTGGFAHRDLAAALDLPGYEVYASLGENILAGPPGIDGNQMEAAWMNSPEHVANILGDYDSFGMGLAHDAAGNVRAVTNFGRHW